MNHFDQSLKQERNIRTMHDALILEALKKVCAESGLTFEHSRNGNNAEDQAGADIVLKVREQRQPLKVDLKLSKSDVWRVPLEWRLGKNQHGLPWGISGKSDLIIWLNPKHDHFYWCKAKPLAAKLKTLTDNERAALIRCEIESKDWHKKGNYTTLASMMQPTHFIKLVEGFGGVLQ